MVTHVLLYQYVRYISIVMILHASNLHLCKNLSFFPSSEKIIMYRTITVVEEVICRFPRAFVQLWVKNIIDKSDFR